MKNEPKIKKFVIKFEEPFLGTYDPRSLPPKTTYVLGLDKTYPVTFFGEMEKPHWRILMSFICHQIQNRTIRRKNDFLYFFSEVVPNQISNTFNRIIKIGPAEKS